jgi:hypothetical protein
MNLFNKAIASAAIATTATLSLSAKAEALTFSIGQNFTGLTLNDIVDLTGYGFDPPDTMGAVGPDHFVEFINGGYSIYDKTNGTAVQTMSDVQFWTSVANLDLTDFLSNPNNFLIDPRILYDPTSQRWFAAEIDVPFQENGDNASNNFLLAVSNSSDPTAGWTGFKIDADSTDSYFADYPTLGLNADGVYIASNNFNLFTDPNDTVLGVTLVSIPKADLLAPTPTIANLTIFENLDARQFGFTLQPAVDFGPSDGREPILARQCTGLDCSDFSSPYTVLPRTDLFNTGTSLASLGLPLNIGVSPYSHPPLATQPDGSVQIRAGDTRINSTVYKVNNSLWTVHSTELNGRSALRWYEIDATTNAVLQSGTIGDTDHDYFYPSIAVNEFGHAVIGFSRSGLDEFVSSYAVVGDTMDGVTSFTDPILLKAGLDNYHLSGGDFERWGDYSATTVDPTDPFSFWTIQEFAAQPGTFPSTWATQITQIRIAPSTVPEPTSVLGLLAFGAFGVGSRLKRKQQQNDQNNNLN